MKRLVCLLLLLAFSSTAHAAVLVFSVNGAYVSKPDIATFSTSPDCVGKRAVVTDHQIITTPITLAGGRTLSFAGAGYVTFSGAGALTGLREARPEWFGLNTSPGVTNMTAAVAAAANSLVPGGKLILSDFYGLYGSGTQLLLLTKPIEIAGTSAALTGLVYAASVGATTDIVRISPNMTYGDDGAFYHFHDFAIIPYSGTPGRHCLVPDTTTTGQHLKNMVIERLNLTSLAGHGINSVNPSNTDGWFTSTIRDSLIVGGVYLNGAGDSISIIHNTITGAGWGVYANLVPGANALLIEGNNITSTSGCVKSVGGGDPRIVHNNFESLAANPDTDSSMVLIDGTTINPSHTAEISHNTFSMLGGYSLVGLNLKHAYMPSVDNNYFGRSNNVTQTGINITADASYTVVGANHVTGTGADYVAYVADAGLGTRGIYKTLTPNAAYQAYSGFPSPEGPTYFIAADGMITITATLSKVSGGAWTDGTTLFTLPAGARPKADQYFPVLLDGGVFSMGMVKVKADGTVLVYGVTGGVYNYVAVNGLSYHVYQ